MTIVEIARVIFERANSEHLENVFVLAWSFWHRRNKRIHEKCSIHPYDSVDFTLSLFKNYKTTTTLPTVQKLSVTGKPSIRLPEIKLEWHTI